MTQLEYARQGIITEQIQNAAQREGVSAEELRAGIASGEIVLPANINHPNCIPMAVGKGMSIKVNANIGTSDAFPRLENELTKLDAALKAGAHAVMDLSTGGDLDINRKSIIEHSNIMVGTVPIYNALVEAQQKRGSMVEMSAEDLFAAIERHCADGADFITVHCGITRSVIDQLKESGRIMDIVSRGGAFTTAWMLHHEKENPLFEQYDRLLEIAHRYDATLSLGDGLRPGCIEDASDGPQIAELIILGNLVQRARQAGVQVMVEGPGHVPLDQIQANIRMAKTLCHNAPFYVLGPLVTDIAPGYDHITSAIGGAIAAASGADFLCYVTPAEHLGLPTVDDVTDGVIAARIAAHAADLARGLKPAWEWDREMGKARKDLDWQRQMELSINPEKAQRIRDSRNDDRQNCCTMCGDFCAYKIVSEYLGRTYTGSC